MDAFFDRLLREGITAIADVRANPISRRYGFARRTMERISNKVGVEYQHYPLLGIPGTLRSSLTDLASYQRLFDRYERETLSRQHAEINRLANSVAEVPTVLVCMEHDVDYCHRSRLAAAVSRVGGLPVHHLM